MSSTDRHRSTLAALAVALLGAFCTPAKDQGAEAASSASLSASAAAASFEHELGNGPTPWSHTDFDAGEDDFTFAIVGDLTGGERPEIFRVGMEQLAILRPEIILSVGDLIEGASDDHDPLTAEWESFDERASLAPAPLFRVAGNHDVTAQPLRDVWNERYGPIHYHFVYRNVLFLVFDTEDHTPEFRERITAARNEAVAKLDAGDIEGWTGSEYYNMSERQTGQIGTAQSEYFRRVIAEHPDVRWTFLFMHKPVWQADDPEYMAIEEALAGRPHSVFAGHFHYFTHDVRNGMEHVQLATTGGSQSATNEMAFDHVTLVRMTDDGPSVAHLRLDGILDSEGKLPAGADTLCFQASRCGVTN